MQHMVLLLHAIVVYHIDNETRELKKSRYFAYIASFVLIASFVRITSIVFIGGVKKCV